jgi:hypothetical protein
MVDKKITALDAITSASATDLLPIIQNVATTPVTRKSTLTQIKNYLYSFLTTAGDIIYATSASTPARIPIGSGSQVLTVSASGSPAWESRPKFVPFTTPITSTYYDGDAFSTTSKTLINVSASFVGVPSGTKALNVRMSVRDAASAGGDYYLVLSPNNTASSGIFCRTSKVPNDALCEQTAIVPCNTDGNIYYQTAVSSGGAMDIWLEVWGYWI